MSNDPSSADLKLPGLSPSLGLSGDEKEERLRKLRDEAARQGVQTTRQQQPTFGYYGQPLLKPPQWTVEVPIYFFIGGVAGSAAVTAAVGTLTGADKKLVRDAQWVAAIGGAISPALLISDLGVPSRFLNMLRVFKIQSPMSVGSWTLVAFSSAAAAAAVLGEIERRTSSGIVRFLRGSAQIKAALTGVVLATYTGVLIGATAIPAYNRNVGSLPVHFAASGMGASASLLEILGNEAPALNRIAIGAAAVETAMGMRLEASREPENEVLKKGLEGRMMRIAGVLSGPVPLGLRILSLFVAKTALRRAAAASSIAGSVVTRFAWIQAGKASSRDLVSSMR